MKNKDFGIQFARVTATILIVLCHFFPTINKAAFLGNIFDIGVPMFIILSGILYGEKDGIGNIKKFFIKNYLKICIPVYIWLIIILVVNYFVSHSIYPPSAILIFMLNLQGLPWLFDKIKFELIGDLGILWFTTIIFLCYMLIPILNKLKKLRDDHVIKIMMLFFLLTCAFNYCGIHFWYIFLFSFSFVFSSDILRLRDNKTALILIILTGFSLQLIRLYLRTSIDNTILYNYIVVAISHGGGAYAIYYVCNVFSKIKNKASNIIRFIDTISYEIYICHYSFLKGILSSNLINVNIIVWIFLYIGEVILSAYTINNLSKIIKKLIYTKILDE